MSMSKPTKKTSGHSMWSSWIVCHGDGNVSYDADADAPQRFSTFAAARKRAEAIALDEPNAEIFIYEAVALAQAPVSLPETVRKYPIEHYGKN